MMNYMKIEFDKMDVTLLPNFKCGEKEFAANMFSDGTNRIFKGRLVPGATIGMHTHDDSCEVIFILEGNGTVVESAPGANETTSTPVSAGACLYCPKGYSHSLQNTSDDADLLFYAVVTQQ